MTADMCTEQWINLALIWTVIGSAFLLAALLVLGKGADDNGHGYWREESKKCWEQIRVHSNEKEALMENVQALRKLLAQVEADRDGQLHRAEIAEKKIREYREWVQDQKFEQATRGDA